MHVENTDRAQGFELRDIVCALGCEQTSTFGRNPALVEPGAAQEGAGGQGAQASPGENANTYWGLFRAQGLGF